VWAERSLYVAQGAAGEVEGYVVYRKVDGEYAAFGGPFQLAVENLVAETRDAALALWRLVGSWSSQAERVVYRGGAEDPLLLLLPEQELKPLVEIRWMTRVVDAAGAVGARGFPAGLAAEVHLSLRDEQLPENAGDWVLSVEGGRGHLSRGGRGTVHLGIGAFSSLYAGWAGCGILARAGLVEGAGAEERAALDAAFVGPTPWMLDEF
jgi:predicted acetyltransferase